MSRRRLIDVHTIVKRLGLVAPCAFINRYSCVR